MGEGETTSSWWQWEGFGEKAASEQGLGGGDMAMGMGER